MKFALALGALVATASAAPDLQKRQSGFNTASALGVLETVLPSSLLGLAVTNPGAASSVVASEFAAGATPSWFSALPSDVQSYLTQVTPTPSGNGASALSSAASSIAAGSPGMTPGMTPGRSTPTTPGGTPATTPSTPTPRSSSGSMTGSSSGSSSTGGSGGSGSSGSGGKSSSASTGGVPAQTAAIGMGMAGVAAAVGLIAL